LASSLPSPCVCRYSHRPRSSSTQADRGRPGLLSPPTNRSKASLMTYTGGGCVCVCVCVWGGGEGRKEGVGGHVMNSFVKGPI
jgi:hypothetical protein